MPDSPTPSEPLLATLAITGVGLIGGSIAAAARQRHVAERIVGIGRTEKRLDDAVEAGLIDEGSTDVTVAADADLAVVCTPVDRIAQDVRSLAAVMPETSLMTDAGSTKRALCQELTDLDGAHGPAFIGSHPLAGSTRQGFEHANPDLFDHKVCVLTPQANADPAQMARLETFWKALGAVVLRRTPEEHDQALARTSHLPHLVAAALAGSLSEEDTELSATGLRDTTRIAAGDPSLWVPIFQHNSSAITTALARFQAQLEEFSDGLRRDDGCALQKLLEEAKRKRDGLG